MDNDEIVEGPQGQMLRIPSDLPDQRAETWFIRPEDGGIALYFTRVALDPSGAMGKASSPEQREAVNRTWMPAETFYIFGDSLKAAADSMRRKNG